MLRISCTVLTKDSGTSTPVPSDAPPSVHATASARKALRAQHQKRMFPTVNYTARVSHFDPKSEYHDFRGFFILFWIGLGIMVITTMLRNYRETGNPFPFKQQQVFTENIWELAISDLVMLASTGLNLPLHKIYANSNGWLRWGRGGVWIQTTFQAAWLLFCVAWPFMRQWTWTAQVFFTLHLLALFMKMHSYAFYNGHLNETKRKLDGLDTTTSTASKEAAIVRLRPEIPRYPTSEGRLHGIDSIDASVDKTTDSTLTQLREALAIELTSPLGGVTYPQNLTLSNYMDFLCCPTLCYELEYPRTARTSYSELFYKTLAVFGCVFLLTITSESFIIPVLDESALLLHPHNRLSDNALILAETISRLLFPFTVTFLLVFLVIFEYVLGAFAELTCFADRAFYADWWNSCDWLEFSREWNIPVHNFFRRHVYGAMARGAVPRPVATVVTFAISAAAHELVMGCITKKLRGYGAFAMMLQMPIVMLQRSKWARGHALLNNVLFWISMILGLSMMCALYVLV